ncbi:MAG: hypothetical protein J0J10_20100 [Bosea sp.]|uniref:hypothetical protein n=1 Tax=Bosea sp. (in: a-proteobacteria) TaxID=1871050 RepID=UPI001AC83092|nr:hypothetical protein [Bosea sp. (in: a-proteobacteria)]MBN9471075.1 hypothetical protein [Bosea sp. (in: a-proteobacteria)]
MGQQIEQRPFRVREFRGYALNFAAQLEASLEHTILHILKARDLNRQVLFAAAAAAEIDLVRPEAFLAQIEVRAADVLADFHGLDPDARIARALAVMTPRTTIECVFGTCPDGLLGLFERFGSQPLYGPETYRLAFELFSRPEHRRRAKVLGQLPGQIRPEHVTVAASLDERLLHRSVLERCHQREVAALNRFAEMIVDLCDATPALIRESLDQLAVGTRGCKMTEWAEGWMARQVRLPFVAPIPASDPHLRLRLGREMDDLGRRLRNCAAQRKSFTFLGERLIYEVVKPGEQAVLELLRLTSGDQTHWVCEDLRAPRNRRVSPETAAWVQRKLDQYGIFYQSVAHPSAEQQALHRLVDHTTAFV